MGTGERRWRPTPEDERHTRNAEQVKDNAAGNNTGGTGATQGRRRAPRRAPEERHHEQGGPPHLLPPIGPAGRPRHRLRIRTRCGRRRRPPFRRRRGAVAGALEQPVRGPGALPYPSLPVGRATGAFPSDHLVLVM